MNFSIYTKNLYVHTLFLFFFCGSPYSMGRTTNDCGYGNPNYTSVEYISPEKIYVHCDKSNYVAEENIRFKVYLVNSGTNTLGTNSGVAYIDIIDPLNKITDTKIVRITDGTGHGTIPLPFDVPEGRYILRAYTNHMRNFGRSSFFEKAVYVRAKFSTTKISSYMNMDTPKASELEARFCPEGGQLVSGFNNKIGFKVFGKNGKGVDVKGQIIDGKGNKVTEFSTSKFGRGQFYFLPKSGKSYSAKIDHDGNTVYFDLPATIDKGVAMRIVEVREHYRANIESSLQKGINQYSFVGKQRNGEVFSSKIMGTTANAVIEIPKRVLETGIVKFELRNTRNEIVCERMVFREKQETESLQLDVTEDGTGKKVLVNLVSPSHNAPRERNVHASVSIIKGQGQNVPWEAPGIETYLLLTSEVIGPLENPGHYLDPSTPDRKKDMDILMLTEAWKDYHALNGTTDLTDPEFDYETGIRLSGTIKSAYNRKIPAVAKVSLSYKSGETMGFDETVSDAKGRFVFRNLDFPDTTSVMLQALNISSENETSKGDSDYHIEMHGFSPPDVSYLKEPYEKKGVAYHGRTKRFNLVNDSLYEVDGDVIALEGVDVASKRVREEKRDYSKKRILYKQASQTLDLKDYPELGFMDMLQVLQNRVPGLSVRGFHVYLRGPSSLNEGSNASPEGYGSALILLDGTPVSGSILGEILTSAVDFIDILKGPRAAIYGSRAANGVIAIYTKSGNDGTGTSSVPSKGSNVTFVHPGFRSTAPAKPQSASTGSFKGDGSATVLWQPALTFGKGGKAEISLDGITKEPGRYSITIQGITSGGTPLNLAKTHIVD
ncbi:TonB-dependent receptor [Costertonia aggregata]|uniref:TonB-dependent receptor plug domain-containing protein n=1 Tax=Costertonia aggregata TaxID=343403 RepID=A0A7H9ANY9_9FLAO|nr:TonB-dependent receptor plug domain-containing protein [Costertonia aggregata]QLG45162.1 TonB-dependent receptor plug domain-containing protein [Costertonia aggregata]